MSHYPERLRRREFAVARRTSEERGYDARWRRLRKCFLREHPQCVCGAPATCVDHIVPHHGNDTLMWDRDNWQPLCTECHSRKTVLCDGGFGRKPQSEV